MNEARYKLKLMVALSGRGWDLQAHEDSVSNFVPDISFGVGGMWDGWIEVKYSDKPPKSLNAVHHWTRGQEKWLQDRGTKGSGNCYLLYGTAECCYLWQYPALKNVRHMDWAEAVLFGFQFLGSPSEVAVTLDHFIRNGN